MGYTNYWEQSRDFTDLEWDNIKMDVEYLKEVGYDVEIDRDYFGVGKETEVVYIYPNVDTSEKFKLYKRTPKNNFTDFCKTRMANYDIAVKYMLARAKAELGNDFSYSSD